MRLGFLPRTARARRSWYRLGLSLLTAASTAAILYNLYALEVFVIFFGLVALHELGHYLAARLTGADAWPPLFIPLGYVLIGITIIDNLDPQWRAFVAIAGPLTGLVVAGVAVVATSWWGLPLAAPAVGLGYELWSATLGSDGRRYRKCRKLHREERQ